MHFPVEVVIPPTRSVEDEVRKILSPFDEDCGESTGVNAFWDWWAIGGRYSGRKLLHKFESKKIDAFTQMLSDKKFTVSNFQAGKQELRPKDQIPAVDALWREYFPDGGGVCPLFAHAGESLPGDIMCLGDAPASLKSERILFARGKGDNKFFNCSMMLATSYWNGVVWQETRWDGTLGAAMNMLNETLGTGTDEHKEKNMPSPDWLVVTVDCHS